MTETSENPGYPLSQSVSLPLGFSKRMIATQAVCRWTTDPGAAFNFTKHFYRALLQLILFELELLPRERFNYDGRLLPDQEIVIGRLSRTAFDSGFVHYAHQCFTKLSVVSPSDDILQSYETMYRVCIKRIAVVWTLRSLMADIIESLLLMDRFMYLKESGVVPMLVPLFDQTLSPRNVAVIGLKI